MRLDDLYSHYMLLMASSFDKKMRVKFKKIILVAFNTYCCYYCKNQHRNLQGV